MSGSALGEAGQDEIAKTAAEEEAASSGAERGSSPSCAVDDSDDVDEDFILMQRAEKIHAEQKLKHRHSTMMQLQKAVPFHFSPLFLPLTLSNWDACIALENAAFANPNHRCTPEKFEYRLTRCSYLCFGVFCTVTPEQAKDFELETMSVSKPVESSREDGARHVLCAHIVSTMGTADVVTDADMDYPRNWKDADASKDAKVGHQEVGRTVCVHSLAVSPKLQGLGLGKLAMMSYLQIMNESGIADRVALISQEYLVDYYRRFGFKHLGESKAQFGGGGWHDMVFDLAGPANKRTPV